MFISTNAAIRDVPPTWKDVLIWTGLSDSTDLVARALLLMLIDLSAVCEVAESVRFTIWRAWIWLEIQNSRRSDFYGKFRTRSLARRSSYRSSCEQNDLSDLSRSPCLRFLFQGKIGPGGLGYPSLTRMVKLWDGYHWMAEWAILIWGEWQSLSPVLWTVLEPIAQHRANFVRFACVNQR